MVIALAGARVDSADARDPRFPLRNVELVRTRVRTAFQTIGAQALVSSAACGSDLIALFEAGQLGLRRRVILPFERKCFRDICVTDRPGEWGLMYDGVINAVEEAGDLVVLQQEPLEQAYSEANSAIFDQSMELARATHQPVTVILVWNGVSRGEGDWAASFLLEARTRHLAIREVCTL